MVLISLKLGALALISTLGMVYHYAADSPSLPSHMARETTAIACAAQYGVPGSVAAARFIAELQQLPVEQAVQQALNSKSPVHAMLRAVSQANRSAFEDCAGVRPGYTSVLSAAKRKESTYRTFLRECMECAGRAFRESEVAWPSEGVVLDMVEMMSLDWLASSSHLFDYATKYQPQITALGAPSRSTFRQCMQGVQNSPSGLSVKAKGQRSVSKFESVVADVSGRPVASTGRTAVAKKAARVPMTGGPTRRLMKGGSYYFSSSGCSGDEECSVEECFGVEGSVLNSRTAQHMRIGDVQVGDMLQTTVDHDEVWYLHTVQHTVPMLRLLLSHATLELTAHHLISTPKGIVTAGELSVGDAVWLQGNVQSTVLGIESVKGHVIAPITKSGMIVVNGVVASCYAHGTHDLLHAALAPFRALHSISPSAVLYFGQLGHHLIFHQLASLAPLTQHMNVVLAASIVGAVSMTLLPVVAVAAVAKKAVA